MGSCDGGNGTPSDLGSGESKFIYGSKATLDQQRFSVGSNNKTLAGGNLPGGFDIRISDPGHDHSYTIQTTVGTGILEKLDGRLSVVY